MFRLTVVRSYLEHATVGWLVVGGKVLRTLERPWGDNAPNVSCIPEGTYLVKRDTTGRWQYYSIQNVPNRTFIEIHPANKPEQLAGCLALGLGSTERGDLTDSQSAIDHLMKTVGEEDFLLTFRTYNPHTDGAML